MARPQTNKIVYFPHAVNHGKEMSYLEKKYNNDGYSTWFKILEELGNTNFHYLDLSDEVQIMFLSDRCLISEERLISIISDLVKFREFDEDLWINHKIIYSEKFIASVSDAYKKRSNNCIDKNSLFILLDSLGIRKLSKSESKLYKSTSEVSINPQSKENKSKEDKSKENKSKEEEEKIPTFLIYKDYAITKKENVCLDALLLKYESWKVTGWRNGNGKLIKNWKQSLLNTLPYIKEKNHGLKINTKDNRATTTKAGRQDFG